MIYVGIDVAKDKHDCCITDSSGSLIFPVFTIENSAKGFNCLLEKMQSVSNETSDIKVGIEATGHYSFNLLDFLMKNGLTTYVINPLRTNFYRKGLTLRQTKTDKTDARAIAGMVLTDKTLKPYTMQSFQNENLKALTRYRYVKVQERAKLKISVARLVNILFPELDGLVPTLHMPSVYAMLAQYPGASFIAEAHLTKLTNLLSRASKNHYGRDMAFAMRERARSSIGSVMPARSIELKHTIELINMLGGEIEETENAIRQIMDDIDSPILTIPGISYRMGAMIIAEIGDFSRFSSPDKILAYAGLSPSTYQSGKTESSFSHMEKRGSRYLRYALFNSAKFVCHWDEGFNAYLNKKTGEGKHYNVAISHAVKKLVRLIWKMEKTGSVYRNSFPTPTKSI